MKKLSTVVRVQVRFSEVDNMQMVWHGHYVHYLENAREAFGYQFGLDYMYMFRCGYLAPMADLKLHYQQPAQINDVLLVEITYHPCRASKLMFDYCITRESDQACILTANSIQLFTDLQGNLETSTPEFLTTWRTTMNQ